MKTGIKRETEMEIESDRVALKENTALTHFTVE